MNPAHATLVEDSNPSSIVRWFAVHRLHSCFVFLLLGSVMTDVCAQQAASISDTLQQQRSTSTLGQLLYAAADVYSVVQEHSEPETASAARRKQADACFQQARQSCEQGDISAALQWATRALCAAPDHAGARRVLGYQRASDQWAGGYAARRLQRGEIWHPQFGWIPAADVARYEAGERRWGKRWLSAAEDARRHAKIKNGWLIRTDHFQIVTNHSRQAAAQLAMRLETLYQLWRQLFGGFYLTKAELLVRFDGKQASGYRRKPFQVVYYRTRDQYNAALRRQQPRIGMTLGIYFDATHTSHFFAGPEQDAGTIYHEVVHQLFQESARSAKNVGALANAWAVEGVACYFESLVEHADQNGRRYFTIGGAEAGRLPAARHRRLVDHYYVPLAELSTLGTTDLQQREDLARLYSQSAGLATFFMQYQGGVYRRKFGDLLRQLYAGRDNPGKLEALIGVRYAKLDRQYQAFMEQLAAVGAVEPPANSGIASPVP